MLRIYIIPEESSKVIVARLTQNKWGKGQEMGEVKYVMGEGR